MSRFESFGGGLTNPELEPQVDGIAAATDYTDTDEAFPEERVVARVEPIPTHPGVGLDVPTMSSRQPEPTGETPVPPTATEELVAPQSTALAPLSTPSIPERPNTPPTPVESRRSTEESGTRDNTERAVVDETPSDQLTTSRLDTEADTRPEQPTRTDESVDDDGYVETAEVPPAAVADDSSDSVAATLKSIDEALESNEGYVPYTPPDPDKPDPFTDDALARGPRDDETEVAAQRSLSTSWDSEPAGSLMVGGPSAQQRGTTPTGQLAGRHLMMRPPEDISRMHRPAGDDILLPESGIIAGEISEGRSSTVFDLSRIPAEQRGAVALSLIGAMGGDDVPLSRFIPFFEETMYAYRGSGLPADFLAWLNTCTVRDTREILTGTTDILSEEPRAQEFARRIMELWVQSAMIMGSASTAATPSPDSEASGSATHEYLLAGSDRDRLEGDIISEANVRLFDLAQVPEERRGIAFLGLLDASGAGDQLLSSHISLPRLQIERLMRAYGSDGADEVVTWLNNRSVREVYGILSHGMGISGSPINDVYVYDTYVYHVLEIWVQSAMIMGDQPERPM